MAPAHHRRSKNAVTIAALAVLLTAATAARAQNGDVFASSGGRSCGYPGYRYDMSKVEAAAKGYPNSEILILTPGEKREIEKKLALQDPRSGEPIVQMAPCFNCSPEYDAWHSLQPRRTHPRRCLREYWRRRSAAGQRRVRQQRRQEAADVRRRRHTQ